MGRRVLRKGDMSLSEILNFHFFIILFILHNIMQVWMIAVFPTLEKGKKKNSEKLNDVSNRTKS